MPKRFLFGKNCTLLLVLLVFLPAGALASKVSDLWVTAYQTQKAIQTGNTRLPPEAVRWWYSSKEKAYIIFLPAGMNAGSLQICFTGPRSLTNGRQEVQSGDTVDFLTPGEKVTLTSGKDEYTLKIMQSANIPAMFLSTESGSAQSIHKSKENEEKGFLVMMDANGDYVYNDGLSQIKCRGNYSFTLSKKPYQIKLDKACDLCGMGKAKT